MRYCLPLVALVYFTTPVFAQDAKDSARDGEDTETPIATKEEEPKICRTIQTDMSSRRKERVCMTKDEWTAYKRRR